MAENASDADIKSAFKKLALKYHPDKNDGDPEMEERFKEVNLAYQVLSNPYEKARYDIQLMYGAQAANKPTESYQQPQQPTYTYKRPPKRPNYTEPKIDWRENWIATAYAFGFTLVVASIVMIVITVKQYIDERAHEKLLLERREIFEDVKREYAYGNVDTALFKLNNLGNFMPSETDIQEYKVSLYESFIYNGESNFNTGDYAEAIIYFELIENYASVKPLPLKEHLAMSYKKTSQPHKAIKLLKELLVYNYRNLEVYVSLAEIYRDMIQNHSEALRYFELGNKLAVKKYESIYGKAYPLVLNGDYLPPVHYKLYTGLADIYLKNEAYQEAINATRWNISIWPDSTRNYLIAAKGHFFLGELDRACELVLDARLAGYTGDPEFDCD